MSPLAPLQSECLSLVAGLYGAIADAGRFAEQRARCEEWLARQGTDTPAGEFLRRQMERAVEALALACRANSAVPSACAILTVDDGGRVVAAGSEAWTLLRSGIAGEDPLRLPFALRAFVEDVCLSLAVPRALRVPLDDGSTELAGVVLGVDQVRHTVGAMRVITLLLCDVGGPEARPAALPPRRADVRTFRPRSPAPYEVGLAADRSA